MKRAISTFALVAVTSCVITFGRDASAGETLYRWLDARGNPVHSDRPPPKGVDYEVISTGGNLVRPVGAEEGAVPLEVKPRVGTEFEVVNTGKVGIEKNPEYCQRARNNLQTLNSSARIRLRNDQGEFRYIDEEEKNEQRERALETVRVHCD